MSKISYIDTNSNILFTNVIAPVKSLKATISRDGYRDEHNQLIDDDYRGQIQPPTKFINVIDIDWNGAYLESLDTYINTTGDLLHQIEVIYNQSKDIDLSAYAKKTDIPTRITDLIGSDNYATISWVQDYVPRYAKSAYEVYVEYQIEQGLPYLNKEEWLESLHGKDGENGYSAYQIAQRYGYIGTEEEWLGSLKGADGIDGKDGETGKSAYEVAVDKGYVGTEEEWLDSLKGATGATGAKGDTGASVNLLGYYDTVEELKAATIDTINAIGDAYNIAGTFYVYNDKYTSIDDKWKPAGRYQGDNGKSAYEIALENGYVGTEEEWLASLHGKDGETGATGATGNDGSSAYEIAKSLNPSIGTEEEWLASLKGETGPQGKSAYDIYADLQIAMGLEPLPEKDWLNTLGKTYTAGNRISISEDNVISVIDRESSDMWGII